jgi:hypothetical protein
MHVRFTPKTDKWKVVSPSPLSAKSGDMRRSKKHRYSITSSALPNLGETCGGEQA